MTHVWLYNPETGGVWACPAELAGFYRDVRGWVDADPPDTDAASIDPATADAATFDPAAHNVPEVLEYLDAQANNPAETERVLAAERGSANPRKSIVGG